LRRTPSPFTKLCDKPFNVFTIPLLFVFCFRKICINIVHNYQNFPKKMFLCWILLFKNGINDSGKIERLPTFFSSILCLYLLCTKHNKTKEISESMTNVIVIVIVFLCVNVCSKKQRTYNGKEENVNCIDSYFQSKPMQISSKIFLLFHNFKR
jgi:hypothetical protein